MKAAEIIDQVIKANLAPTLKSEGFKKTARTFHRASGPAIHVVNVQASQWGSSDEGRFTLNLGVYVPELARMLGDAVHEKPKEYQCQARARIGSLMPAGSDDWWDVSPSTDLAALTREVEARYVEFGRPWLEARSSYRDLESLLQGGLARAAVALLDGRREDARRRVAGLIAQREAITPAYQAEVRAFGEKHALLG